MAALTLSKQSFIQILHPSPFAQGSDGISSLAEAEVIPEL